MAKKRKHLDSPSNQGNETYKALKGGMAPPSRLDQPTSRTTFLVCAILLFLTLAVYLQTRGHQFISLDDDEYVTNNINVAKGITGETISWAFTSMEAANWHPVTWLSHLMDVSIYGMDPAGHHLTNVIIHTATALLLLLLLLRWTGAVWPSAFVAAMFALHPTHVESVAWVAERKDVLSALFWVITLFLYSRYAIGRKPEWYVASLASFALGLMSKPMLVTLPMVLLLLDLWPLGRYRDDEEGTPTLGNILAKAPKLLLEKVPFLVLSLLSATMTIYAQGSKGAINTLTVMPLEHRLENAFISYVRYLGKTLWPRDLAVMYPFPQAIPYWQAIASVFLLIAISIAVIRAGKRHPYLPVGWFWYLITLIPVIGFVQVGSQAMADRYTYIPGIGLFIVAAWGGGEFSRQYRVPKAACAIIGGAVVLASTLVTRHQVGYWHDNVSLYQHTLDITEGNTLIRNNLGNAFTKEGKFDEAAREYRQAIAAAPTYSPAHFNLGLALAGKGDLDGAIPEYQEAIRLNPAYTDARYNLGIALGTRGKTDAAIKEFQEVLRLNPSYPGVHNNLGAAYAGKGDTTAAIGEFKEESRVNPQNTMAYTNVGILLLRKGDVDGAIKEFQEAIRLTPGLSEAHNNLGAAYERKGDLDGAIGEYREAVRVNPGDQLAQNNLKAALVRKKAKG